MKKPKFSFTWMTKNIVQQNPKGLKRFSASYKSKTEIGIKSLRCLITLSQYAITIVTCLSFIVSTTEK